MRCEGRNAGEMGTRPQKTVTGLTWINAAVGIFTSIITYVAADLDRTLLIVILS